MAKLTGMDRVERAIIGAAHKALRTTVKDYVIARTKFYLDAQVDRPGKKMPEKAESTKKQYRRKGWNTEKFLVATGRATKMTSAFNSSLGELQVYPSDPDNVLEFNITSRTLWVIDGKDVEQGASQLIAEEVQRALKS